ncbi:TPA: Sir2 family NAD-dependent protein deacetylase [Stenotrophomonas maltophilia]|uniref:Sir2 family NAD-dependent protein deacetylase n=1 Tax=Burkholderia sp. LMG 13014 TaxID=2709306 RepID=UPI00196574E7|nr:Sir2 family NAD-dependent protein deacetylase [Burkholderia sp. LMG 13014]HDS1367960.1 hypothetical protein [Stenotrophomonas maltophilia]HEJ3239989.1 hypothetical protein [Pseudomonas aeruginosa]HDS1372574.1 hypothetical protein [Stenotrophomonas maltophilia]HDS1376499.1 hypothetical protein [Stenotrophomonas maltophilia]HDS1381353.1 hypothetical protein [Stenotrophomonas maltophilia]
MTEHLQTVMEHIQAADAIVVGASNGLSISEGIHIFAENEDFARHFGEFRAQHGFRCIIQGCFHPCPSEAQKWAFFSRMHQYFLRDKAPSRVMQDLHDLVKDKNHFVLTSNIDAHFHLAGFDPSRLFEIEGNCRNMQCAVACHDRLYPGDDVLSELAQSVQDGKIPEELLPKCPECGGPLKVHIEVDRMFLKGSEWQERRRRFTDFLGDASGKKIVFLELGVGARNQLIKAPLMRIAASEPNARYICFNRGSEVYIPREIESKAIGVDGDIAQALRQLAAMLPA